MLRVAERGPRTDSERALATLWQQAHTLPDGLVAEDGRRFRVVYPGRANPREGPDFHDAVIATESGQLVTGDVELHLKAPDWYSHRHHNDPNYNGVVLHVVLSPKGAATSSQHSGMQAPVASIASFAGQLSQTTTSDGAGAVGLIASDRGDIGEALDLAGDQRFFAKSRGFALEMEESSPDQVVYSALMEALGYASNRKPFRLLAKRVPVSALASLRDEPVATRLLAIQAALVGASGLMSYVKPPEDQSLLRRLLRDMPKARPMSVRHWNLFRVRPANHPVKRVMGAAHVVDRYVGSGLALGLEQDFSSGGDGYSAGSLVARPFIGDGRAKDMMVNVVLPFLHAYGGMKQSTDLRIRCLESYHGFPRLAENEVTREMRRLLGATEADVTNARRQQGLIHLYKTRLKMPSPA